MSTPRQLRSLRSTDRAPTPPKDAPGGRKRLQSNPDETTAKRSKTINNSEKEESTEEEQQPVKKAATKGKGKKGKKNRFVTYSYERLPAYSLNLR